jgi:hypothetical protein
MKLPTFELAKPPELNWSEAEGYWAVIDGCDDVVAIRCYEEDARKLVLDADVSHSVYKLKAVWK